MINYSNISESIQFYQEKYQYYPINVSWTAGADFINITLPENRKGIKSDLGILVGSAEQSILELVRTKSLKGKYQATTPCFRDDLIDNLHQKYFLKTELFNNISVTRNSLDEMITAAKTFFEQYLTIRVTQLVENTYDIVEYFSGIELGSYGIRSHPLVGSWIYGTGCAEPRLSYVIENQGKICLEQLKK